LHTWQTAPLLPQAPVVLEGVMHVPLGAQHPPRQVELQDPPSVPASPWPGTVQAPDWQTSDDEQRTHAPPWVPQAAVLVPALQSPSPPQQPLQLDALHVVPGWPQDGTNEAATPTAKARTKVRRSFMDVRLVPGKSTTYSSPTKKGAT
jgi:hypothetical protein